MAPPSFDSFPELNPPRASTQASSSSRNPSSKSSRESSSKRIRTNDFLKGIEAELKEDGKKLQKLSKKERIVTTSAKGKEREVESWYSDQKGDELNVKYGSLHKGDVPKYRRLGGGRVVGLNSGLRITKETAYSGRGLEIDRAGRLVTPRYVDPRSFSHLNSRQLKRVILLVPSLSRSLDPFLPDSEVVDSSRYIPLLPEESIAAKLDSLEFEKDQDYRSIAGIIKPTDLNEGEEQLDTDFDVGGQDGESTEEIMKKKLIEFDRAVRKDPSDISKWIEFVDFQEAVSLAASGGRFSGTERTSTTEIKLSILDRAFTYSQNKRSIQLILVYLKTIEEIWTSKRVMDKWLKFLEEHSQELDLWIEYINYRQGNSSTFNVRDVVDIYTDCFKILIAQSAASGGLESIERNLIYLFQRCCLLLRQAGFNERSLAAYQAIIDLNFFAPPSKTTTHHTSTATVTPEMMERLEDFWDAEGPRIGEAGAIGWKNQVEQEANTGTKLSTSLGAGSSAVEPNLAEDVYTNWATVESISTGPARTTDEGVDEDVDPYRCILFDDIRDFLFLVSNQSSRTLLVYSFLQFLGIPFLPVNQTSSNFRQNDPFIQTQFFESPSLREKFWIPFARINVEDSLDLSESWTFRDTPCTMDTLFEILKPGDLEDVDCDFTRRVFEVLWPEVKEDYFTLHYIAFEAAVNPKSAIKLAKTILRSNRTSHLLLWDGYARLEIARNKIEAARGVYVTALTLGEESGEDKIQLWRSWAEMELNGGRENLALKVIVEAAGVGTSKDLGELATVDIDVRPTSSVVLRAIQYYKSTLSTTLSLSTLYLLTLLTYLTQTESQALSAGLEILHSYIATLKAYDLLTTPQHEISLAMMTQLVAIDRNRGKGWKPIIGREVFVEALGSFKSSARFLFGFLQGEARMKIQNHVRKIINEDLNSPTSRSSQSYLFSIYAETTLSTNSIYRVRALFDQAIGNSTIKKSPSLWKMYIEFEIRNGDSARVKGLIFRAVSECPWCKEFYLLPFHSELRPLFTIKELKLFYMGLLEKGLRVKNEIDFEEERVMEVEDDSEARDDTEVIFEERKKLMPY